MGWQPGHGPGADDVPGSSPDLPDKRQTPPGLHWAIGQLPALESELKSADAATVRNPRLAGFAKDGAWDKSGPSAALGVALEDASGPEWRCAGASRDEMIGLLRRWTALEARAAAARLGVLRALIRDEDQPLPGGGYHGDLPDGWTRSLTYEVAAALAVSVPTADNMMWLAWDLQVRLPGVLALLADGSLAYSKARAVADVFQLLSDEDAAQAEAMILAELPGKNYGQVKKLAEQAAITVDPDSATRRREHAEREKSRVQLFREESGAAALNGRDLPTAEALAAHAGVCARAQQYKDSDVFPDIRMDQFRAAAYLDLLKSISAEARIALGVLPGFDTDPPDRGEPGGGGPGGDGPEGDGPEGDGGPPDSSSPSSSLELAPRLTDLVLPLATLLGLAERPGESHGLGPLDPDLCRALADAAVNSSYSTVCVTVTDRDGVAIGHGCAKAPRKQQPGAAAGRAQSDSSPVGPLTALPARANLTIPAVRLTELARPGAPPGQRPWSLTRNQDPGRTRHPGPPGGFGRWTLTLPDGRQLTVDLDEVPTFACDHRHESHAYQPNDHLRHLVQIRDGDCTFPACSRHARESDFEHAVPYDQGGRTCACNAGARSRQCHRVKQSRGWTVTQPRPGWHQWETPAGRSYTQGPKRYPA
jgi:Domain of unknown function (DUF222)